MSPGSPRSETTASVPGAYAKIPTTNGLTVCRMRLHMAYASYVTYGRFATSAIRPRPDYYPYKTQHFRALSI